MIKTSLALLACLSLLAFTGEKEAYEIYDIKGKESSYEKMLKAASEADIVFFGELHDNPICHWLQLELTRDLYDLKKDKLVLGAEMFESDDQVALNEYLSGRISEKTLKDEAKLWPNFKTDYKPLLDLAKKNKLGFIATNIPRRYSNMVYTKGFAALDSIDNRAKEWIAPLPIKYDGELKCYKDIFTAAGGHAGENLPKSQAIKDATMAHFILKNFEKGKLFLHYNGTYHSDNHQSIVWYLKQANPDLKIVTISSVMQPQAEPLDKDKQGLGDFILCVPENMTRTH